MSGLWDLQPSLLSVKKKKEDKNTQMTTNDTLIINFLKYTLVALRT